MNDLEKQLSALPLAAPSAELDRRLDDAFAAAARPATISAPWWSLAALGLAGAAAVLALVLHSPPPPAPQLVYRFEAQGALRALLLEPPASRASPPSIVVRVNPS